MITVAFTGSRPGKLWGYDLHAPEYKKLMRILKNMINHLIEKTNSKEYLFVCGGALGFDTIAAITTIKMAMINKKIKIEIAIPFKNQPNAWFNKSDKSLYEDIKRAATKVTYVDTLENYKVDGALEGAYSVSKLQIRNKYMIDKADIVFALYDGSPGGTANAVKYAKKLNKKKVVII